MRPIHLTLTLRLSEAFTGHPIERAEVISSFGRKAFEKKGGYYVFDNYLDWGIPESVIVKTSNYGTHEVGVTCDKMHLQLQESKALGVKGLRKYTCHTEPESLVHLYTGKQPVYKLKSEINPADTSVKLLKRDLLDSTLMYYAPLTKSGEWGDPFLVTEPLTGGVIVREGEFKTGFDKQSRIACLCSLRADKNGNLEFSLSEGISPTSVFYGGTYNFEEA